MLEASQARIRELLSDGMLVLDVGGGARPFPRADWVIDLMSYDQRGLYGPPPDPAEERFTASTWVKRDICDREPWPFATGQFDFSVCSHTLEDVRDPLFVCSELIRVSRAGYIEVPSRLEEQSYGVHGPWVGWSHHRWLIDVGDEQMTFVFKSHVLQARGTDHFPHSFWQGLSEEQRVQTLWWDERFAFAEKIFMDGPSLDAYVSEFVAAHMPGRTRGGWRARLRRAVSMA
jgi:hypothetical protein